MGLQKNENQGLKVRRNSIKEIKESMLRKERFYGEKVAYDYLANNNFIPDKAWSELREHRNTYKGLREDDRNAEHYLYALAAVYNKDEPEWKMKVANGLYVGGKTIINEVLGDKSPWRGSPSTFDETKAGHLGSEDGNLTREQLMQNVLTLQQQNKAQEIMQQENLKQDNSNTLK